MPPTLKRRRRSGSSSSSSSRSSGSENSVPRGYVKPGQKRHSRSRSGTRTFLAATGTSGAAYDHHDDRIGGPVTRDSGDTRTRTQNNQKRGGMRGWSDSDDDAGRYQLKAQNLPSASSYRQASKAVAVGLATRAADQSIFIADKDPMKSDLAERSAGAFDFASRDVVAAKESMDKKRRSRSRDRKNEDGNVKRKGKEAPTQQKETKERKGRKEEDDEDYSGSESSEDDRRKEKSKKEKQREKEKGEGEGQGEGEGKGFEEGDGEAEGKRTRQSERT